MSHEIETMFWYQQAPWHGLGTRVDEALTVEEAIKKAGLDWDVRLVPMMTTESNLLVPMSKAVVRASDQSVLGVVGNAYRPLQNAEAFSFFNPFVQSGEVRFETAGSLRNGQRVWILAAIQRKDAEIVGGDAIKKYILLSNGHDGTLSLRVGFTPIRVVCANTLRLSHENSESSLLRIRHNVNVVASLNEVQQIINLADETFEATAKQYRRLAKMGVNEADLEKYVREVFEVKDAKESEKVKVVQEVKELFESGRGTEIPGVRGTMWGAYNAVVEFLQYKYGNAKTTDDARMNQLWYGQNSARNQRALDVALKLAA